MPDGGGWRVLGRGRDDHHGQSRVGYDHLEVFVDDASRYAVVVPVNDERSESASWAVELAVAQFAEVTKSQVSIGSPSTAQTYYVYMS